MLNNSERRIEMQLKHPFAAMMAGPSQCGKTTFVEQMILRLDTVISHHLAQEFCIIQSISLRVTD